MVYELQMFDIRLGFDQELFCGVVVSDTGVGFCRLFLLVVCCLPAWCYFLSWFVFA